MVRGIFKIALRLGDHHIFIRKSLKILNILLLFETSFLKNKSLFWKKGHFLVESTMMENATFPYKNALSKANVKTNRMGEYKMHLSQWVGFCN